MNILMSLFPNETMRTIWQVQEQYSRYLCTYPVDGMFINKISFNDEGLWLRVHHIKHYDQGFKHKSHFFVCVCVQVSPSVSITPAIWWWLVGTNLTSKHIVRSLIHFNQITVCSYNALIYIDICSPLEASPVVSCTFPVCIISVLILVLYV